MVVGFYSDDNTQLLASCKQMVLAVPEGETKQTVNVSLPANVPEYYQLKVYLLDEKLQLPLCRPFETNLYTEDITNVRNAVVADFDPAYVVNLDDDMTTNFAVLNESTVQIPYDGEHNILESYDEETGIYVFSNIDENISSLQPDNVVYYNYNNFETILTFTVSDISIEDTTATIQTRENEEGAVFSVVKIEIDSRMEAEESAPTPEETTSVENAEIVQAESPFFSVENAENLRAESPIFSVKNPQLVNSTGLFDEPLHIPLNFILTTEFIKSESKILGKPESIDGRVSISGDLTLQVNVYISLSSQYAEISGNIDNGELKGYVNSYDIFPYNILKHLPAFPEIAVSLVLLEEVFNLTFGLGTLFDGKVEMDFGSIQFGGDFRIICPLLQFPTCESNIEILDEEIFSLKSEGFFGFGAWVGAADKSSWLDVRAGIKTEIKSTGTTMKQDTSSEYEHLCSSCLSGTCYAHVGAGGWIALPLSGLSEFSLFSGDDPLGSFYYSSDVGFGFGECPNKRKIETTTTTKATTTTTKATTATTSKTTATTKATTATTQSTTQTTNTTATTKTTEATTTSVVSNGTYGDLEYKIIDNGSTTYAEISGVVNQEIEEVEIPSEIEEYPVASIGKNGFAYCSSLKSVTIPDSVAKIGSDAFNGCISLTSITIPNSVTKIESTTFNGCT